MCIAATFLLIVAPAGATSASWLKLNARSQTLLRHTLHYRSEVAGSAAQFNRSVSAMPRYACSRNKASSRGTADTLPTG